MDGETVVTKVVRKSEVVPSPPSERVLVSVSVQVVSMGEEASVAERPLVGYGGAVG